MDQPTLILGTVGSTFESHGTRRTPVRPTEAVKREPTPESTVNKKETDEKALQEAVARAREAVAQVDAKLQIEIDKDLHRPVVKVVDSQTGDVIRQIPAEEMLDIAKSLDQVAGLLFKDRV